MTNHIHIVADPSAEDSLHNVFKSLPWSLPMDHNSLCGAKPGQSQAGPKSGELPLAQRDRPLRIKEWQVADYEIDPAEGI